MARATLFRFLCFLLLWSAISGLSLKDLPVAFAAAAFAAWISLRYLTPSRERPRVIGAAVFTLDFVKVAVLSGVDVARRALRPDPDLKPGFVTAPLRLPPGNAREAFLAFASLLPGTLPTGVEASNPQALAVHGLDMRQPIAEDLSAEEDLFIRALGS
jgi:multicomponent Na+:H+ antiporter subunit E